VVAERLRAVRENLGWARHDVELKSNGRMRAGRLGTYERGERRISVEVLHQLASVYGLDVAELLPAGRDIDPDTRVAALSFDWKAVCRRAKQPDGEPLHQFLTMVRAMRRSTPDSDRVVIRGSDLLVLAVIHRESPERTLALFRSWGVLLET